MTVAPESADPTALQELVLITGMSGSGKSVAVRALEDAGYYCVDNLPPELLLPFVEMHREGGRERLAIAVDVRSARSLHKVPGVLRALRERGIVVKSLFLDSSTPTLVHRFSETRRRHPLSSPSLDGDAGDQQRALIDAIELERELLADLREHAHVIDSSIMRATQLQNYVKALLTLEDRAQKSLVLVFESFAFKRGIPIDADYVFDVRMLPNPHYEPELKRLTGLDEPVALYLQRHDSVAEMQAHISGFLHHWLPLLAKDQRNYVTVAIGCTGGQHRSVYLVEQLGAAFSHEWNTLKRHRELDQKAS
ncbi:MAG: RNase adapter protein RapZ [Paracidovorax wautersii]|uniref:RNase adapter protein RapZ n=1 Tax=Paracidovorax wautersii TaxID=1177982 RepID=A0A7V8FL36_9BURK|nr:MAG: RNase adapter protein RapZ [Paracidovorax wautersii]